MIDSDELKEGVQYDNSIYLNSEWIDDINQVNVIAKGLKITFTRPGHTLKIRVTKE